MLFPFNDIDNTSVALESIEYIRRGSTQYQIVIQFKDGLDIIVKYDAVDDVDKDLARLRRKLILFNSIHLNV